MKRVVLKFGLIGAALFAVMMSITMKFQSQIGIDKGEIIGYTTMVLAFLMIFFGVRSYRDNEAGGYVSFGKAFQVGLLIALIASAGYVATWEVMYYNFMPDFADKYAQTVIDRAKKSGATPEQIAQQKEKMQQFAESYKNPIVNISYTFIEAFPVGLVFALVSAGILRRRAGTTDTVLERARTVA